MAITRVFPVPVAILIARRKIPRFRLSLMLRILSRIDRDEGLSGATSASQIRVSSASTCAKNGRGSEAELLQYSSSSRLTYAMNAGICAFAPGFDMPADLVDAFVDVQSIGGLGAVLRSARGTGR